MRKARRLCLTLQYPCAVFNRPKDQHRKGREEIIFLSTYHVPFWVSGTTPLPNLVPTVTLLCLRQSPCVVLVQTILSQPSEQRITGTYHQTWDPTVNILVM